MKLSHLLALCLIICSLKAQAFELIMIQAVSDTKKTFITRNGKRQGIIEGVTATFTAENVSILAKALNVAGTYTQWQVINPEISVPFEKGSIVTYYKANEYLWALAPEQERRKYIKSQVVEPKRSWVFKGAITRGISESVSEVPATNSTRGGFLGEIYYERDFTTTFAWDIGARYEREVINYPGGSLITARSLLIADVIYYFDQLKDLINGRIYTAAGVGYGQSNTTAVTLTQSGPVAMLPAIKLGLDLPFNYEWTFLMDLGFESLQTKEQREDGRNQTTTQTNFKAGFGLRRIF